MLFTAKAIIIQKQLRQVSWLSRLIMPSRRVATVARYYKQHSVLKGIGITVARQPMILTWFPVRPVLPGTLTTPYLNELHLQM